MREKLLSLVACLGVAAVLQTGDVCLAQDRTEQPVPRDAETKADMVLLGGSIYTVDNTRRWSEAVAISNGKIIYVGTDRGVQPFIGGRTRVQELSGRLVLPGFHDSHVHLLDGGIHLNECNLDNANSKEELFATIKQYAAAHPALAWVRGAGWALPIFEGANPRKEELDAIISDRPAAFVSADAHSIWANSLALRAAGITKDTKDPPHGRIERTADGAPSGTLRESAVELLEDAMPRLSDKERVKGLADAVALANRFGITSVQDADCNADVLNAYLELQRQSRLTLKVVAALHTYPDRGPAQVRQLIRMREKFSVGRVHATTAKIFADGVIEAHTAALQEPYADRPNEKGMPNYTPEALNELVSALSLARFQIHIHAIGDAAVHNALNALEGEAAQNTQLRPEIAHLELVDPADIQRFRKIGVIANCQPFWAYNDTYIQKCTAPLLGKERSSRLYQFQSIYQTGANMCGGSDWPVSTMNPLEAIQVAVTRQPPDKPNEPTWLPDERLALPDAIAAYTIGGAYANHDEADNGSIEVGKAADLIVLDKNVFAIPKMEIGKAKVVLALLDGTEVFRDESFPQQDVAKADSNRRPYAN